ncbi:MAG: asparagine--tRNA ligase [Bacteroidetes bacterium 4572_128]|nr:MAG: asparagine--tRNA ligase [Bacteroidetes bacterium 4572_128]
MKNILIKTLFEKSEEFFEKKIFISAWVRTIRSSKKFGFIELNDGSCFKNIQIVYDNSLDNFEKITKLSLGSSISVNGELVKSMGKGQTVEVHAKSIEIISYSSLENPIQKKRHSLEYLRTIAYLRPRTNTFKAVFRVRSLIAYAIHKFFQDRNFVYVHTPIITSTDAEGAGQMFKVSTLDLENPPKDENKNVDFSKELFGKATFLTVSGQLAVEPFCMGFGNVYTFGPTFRAENSNTQRHANEFWMIEPEISFADLEDDMELAEDMLKYIINYVLENAPDEMDFFNRFIDKTLLKRLQNVTKSKFVKITYTKAIEILEKSNKKFEFPVKWGNDLQTEHERFLTEKIYKKPVFVTDYPKDIKAFYMKNNPDNKTVRAMDLLVPEIGEIIGGSQREENLEVLIKRMKELNMPIEEYSWYLDLRRFGTFKHAGFGLGFERAVMYITGMKNIRDVLPYPRTPNNAMF